MFHFEPYGNIALTDYIELRFNRLSNFKPYKQIMTNSYYKVPIDLVGIEYDGDYVYAIYEENGDTVERLVIGDDEFIYLYSSFEETKKEIFIASILDAFHVVFRGKFHNPFPIYDFFRLKMFNKIQSLPDFEMTGDLYLTHTPTGQQFYLFTEDNQEYFIQQKDMSSKTQPAIVDRIDRVFKAAQLAHLFL